MDISKLTAMFVSSDERPVAVLGTNTAETFFSTGTLGNGFAVLSNKRVYFRGRSFVRTGKRFSARSEERVVDVQNITGSGFIYSNPVWLLVLSIVLFIGAIVCLTQIINGSNAWPALIPALLLSAVSFALYRIKKRTLFEISFAGGGIAFNVSWFPMAEAQFFQKNLKLVGDAIKAQEKQGVGGFSAADELGKLAQLLAQGLITQEEFETQKRRLISYR